ncbi:MAG TPA: WD40 repeat domain-containing protein [Solirubrobacteraceae bacterium]|nr:WD40 repeat domain-containing protein [Solirubrobacteraceae bacterium]
MITGRRAYPRWLVRGLVLLALGMTVLAAVSSREYHATLAARNAALSRLVAVEAHNAEHTDPALAMQLALVAYRLSQTVQARSALLDATAAETPTRLIGRPGPTFLALGDDGHRVAVAHQGDGRVVILGRHEAQLSQLAVIGGPGVTGPARPRAVAISDNGQWLAVGDGAGRVTLWSLRSSAHPLRLAVLRAGRGAVRGLGFSPAGGALAAADADGDVQRWSLAHPDRPVPAAPLVAPGGRPLDAVSYSPDGRTLGSVGGAGQLVIWAAHAGARPLVRARLGTAELRALTYAPSGHALAVAGQDGRVRILALDRAGRPRAVGPLVSLRAVAAVTSLAFSRDGRYLAGGTAAKTLAVWSTSSWARVATLPHPAAVTGAAFIDGDARVISVDAAGTTTLWPFPPPSTDTFGRAVTGVEYWRRRPILRVSLRSGRTDLWDVVDEWRPAPVGAWYAAPPSAAAPGAYWTRPAPAPADPSAGAAALRLTRARAAVAGSALSSSGRLFAVAGADHRVWLWAVSDPAHPRLLARLGGFSAGVSAVLFTGNGQTLFAASADHTVRVWSLARPAHPLELPSSPLLGPSTALTRLALSPDNDTLAVATVDGRVWLWGVARPAKASLVAVLTAAHGRLRALAFSPSDSTLVAGGDRRRLTFWHYRPFEAVDRICSLAGSPITPGEWQLEVPGAPYRPPCAGWTPPRRPAAATG